MFKKVNKKSTRKIDQVDNPTPQNNFDEEELNLDLKREKAKPKVFLKKQRKTNALRMTENAYVSNQEALLENIDQIEEGNESK